MTILCGVQQIKYLHMLCKIAVGVQVLRGAYVLLRAYGLCRGGGGWASPNCAGHDQGGQV